jgi:putative redox protein
MEILVNSISGFAYRVNIGNHEVVVDQPREDGGEDLGPTPTDLFVAGLASCAAYYAGRFLARRGISAESVSARCRYRISAERPARVESIDVTLDVPPGLSDEVMAAALRSAEHCTVHNSLSRPPEVTISLAEAAAAA